MWHRRKNEKIKDVFCGKLKFTEENDGHLSDRLGASYFFICVLSYIVYYNGVLKEAYALIEQNMQQHEIVIEERLDSYESVLYEMVCDSNMIKMAKVLNSDVPGEKIVEKNNMNTILQNYIYTYDGIRSIVWMSQKDFVGYSRWYSSVGEVIWSNPEIRQEVYTKIQENPTEITYMLSLIHI